MPTVKFTAKDEGVTREFAKLEGKVSRLQDKLDAAGRAGTRAGKSMKDTGEHAGKAFDPQRITQWVTGLLAGGAALQVITGELAAQHDLEKKQASSQVTLASARKDVLRNMAGVDAATKQEALASMRRMSTETGIEERFILQGFAQGYSASGGDQAATEAALRLGTKYLADKPEQIGGYVGSLIDMSKVTRTTDPEINQGLLTVTSAASRVVDPMQQARNIPRAMVNMQAYDTSANTGSALFSALSNATADFMGATSGTGVVALTQQMQKFFEADDRRDPGTSALRIAALQGDKDLATEFLSEASFEKTVGGPIKDFLLDRDSSMAKTFAKDLAALPGPEGLRRIGRSVTADFEIDPAEATARRVRLFG
ncbi:MAG TPA: hypothetical protein VM487_02250, partial [Phycisphaerae bacterium]|nr:hypothetical protein [Phycisphaerae bacterium]